MPTANSTLYRWTGTEGTAVPLGVTWMEDTQQYNFSLYAPDADQVQLLLYSNQDFENPILSVDLDPAVHKSWTAWHYPLAGRLVLEKGIKYYAYRVSNPGQPGADFDKILLDPLARAVFFPPGHDRGAACRPGSNAGKAPLGHLLPLHLPAAVLPEPVSAKHEADLVIYEMHVRGFTMRDPAVPPAHRGTYLGVIDKIPYLQDLGVTAVELLPIFQFDPKEGNYWGYSPLNFFAPHEGYASARGQQLDEFRQMVQALHQAGIEVLLDVVYNHTTEGDFRGPTYSFRGIANNSYYIMNSDGEHYWDASGTGNSLCSGEAVVRRMILDSMRSWVNDMGIDGYRFDLATVLTRTEEGQLDKEFTLVNDINGEPAFAKVRLIAEAWDAGGGTIGYQLGQAWPGLRWLQWNGKYRDLVRRFVKGDPGLVNELTTRIYGSDDLFPDTPQHASRAFQSVNFITCHDGFCLYDLVSYDDKHNDANGEGNRDGNANNLSWNCGWEGDPAADDVVALRQRQVRNFLTLLMMSNGTPMFCAGDEFLNTQKGNNNPWNQDNETSWLDWSLLEKNKDNHQFFKQMIAFRKAHPSIGPGRFWRSRVKWFGTQGDIDRSWDSHTLAFYLDGAALDDDDLYVMVNAYWQPLPFRIQMGAGGQWQRVVDTAAGPVDGFRAEKDRVVLDGLDYTVEQRSVVVLIRPRTR